MASAKHRDGLSERERRFVEAYMGKANGNATQGRHPRRLREENRQSSLEVACLKVNVAGRHSPRGRAADPAVSDREERQRFYST
jgi:hypothetical protein